MKKILLSLVAMLLMLCSFGQVIKCKAYKSTYTTKNETTDQWADWREWKNTDILTEIDLTTNRIKIFSEILQTYDIVEDVGNYLDDDGDDVFEWYCRNEEGLMCSLRLINSSSDGSTSLYVDFANCRYLYLLYLLE
jgi:hypothetical protein